MTDERKINLSRYIPRKASKAFLVRILIYIVVLGSILSILYFYSNKKKVLHPSEIEGVKIELKTNKN
jgi:hypothetical protein